MSYAQLAAQAGTSGTSPMNFNFVMPMPPTAVALISMGFNNATSVVTGITVSVPASGASGTFVRVASIQGGGRTSELWLGYNLQGYPTQFTITWTGASSGFAKIQLVYVDADLTIGPTITAGTPQSGTSTTCDSGTITPVLGDLLVALALWVTGGVSTARTSTGNAFTWFYESQAISTFLVPAFVPALAAVSSRVQWTIPSTAWLGLIASITFAAPAAPGPAFVYKGRDSAEADAGDVA